MRRNKKKKSIMKRKIKKSSSTMIQKGVNIRLCGKRRWKDKRMHKMRRKGREYRTCG